MIAEELLLMRLQLAEAMERVDKLIHIVNSDSPLLTGTFQESKRKFEVMYIKNLLMHFHTQVDSAACP